MSRFWLILVTFALLLTPAAPLRAHPENEEGEHDEPPPKKHEPGSEGKKRQDRSLNGTYQLEIQGYYTGKGTATVAENTISMTVTVKFADGRTAELTASNLKIDGPYFSGRGKVNGETITINGRLDAARSSRLSGSYRSTSGNAGRFVGMLPTDPGDDKWR